MQSRELIPPPNSLGEKQSRPSIHDTADHVIHLYLAMKTATTRELRNSFPTVARWIEEGECVEITRSGKPFARLEPIQAESSTSLAMPDFIGRLRQHFPDEKPGLSSVLDYDRGQR
jgi:antitoxin (DNA-binding transcriptional repressor) of toxin-antitoxin stability system